MSDDDRLTPPKVRLSNSEAMEGAKDDPVVWQSQRAKPEAQAKPYDADAAPVEKVKPWTPDPPEPGTEEAGADYGDLRVLEELNLREGLRQDGEPRMATKVVPKVMPILLILLLALVILAAFQILA